MGEIYLSDEQIAWETFDEILIALYTMVILLVLLFQE